MTTRPAAGRGAAPARGADLHCHSTASDGDLAPADVVARAAANGVRVLALTDHDTMDGVPEAAAAGERLGVAVVTGVELSAAVAVGQMHILGYFPGPPPPAMLTALRRFRILRVERARTIVERLTALGAHVAWDDVTARARGAVGRPHIADALVAAGHAEDREDAFARLIGDACPAYVPSSGLSPRAALGLVTAAGGAPVLAHPLTLRRDPADLRALVTRMRDGGLRGIEVHRPDHDAAARALLGGLATDLGLVPTGGSDFHRPDGAVDLGDTGPTSLSPRVLPDLLGT